VIEHDSVRRVSVWNFPLSATLRTQSDAFDASAPDNAEDDFRATGESEGLADHPETSLCVLSSQVNAPGLREAQLNGIVRGGLTPHANLLFFAPMTPRLTARSPPP
jgi:hypothetical protein